MKLFLHFHSGRFGSVLNISFVEMYFFWYHDFEVKTTQVEIFRINRFFSVFLERIYIWFIKLLNLIFFTK